MSTVKKRVLMVAGVAFVAAVGLLVSINTSQAQEDLVVGTFDPQEVAMNTGLQEKMQGQMEGLRQRAQEAQQNSDQSAMQQIQMDAQKIQQEVIQEFEASMSEVMPAVAEAAGVKIIAQGVAYTAPGIETKDLTSEIIAEMGGGETAASTPDADAAVPSEDVEEATEEETRR